MILTVTMNPSIDKVYSIKDYKTGGVFRPDALTATAGGKGINVARVANILGEKVMATGLIGGRNGSFIEDEVKKLGVESLFVHINKESRNCIAVMDKKNGTSTEILEPGPRISDEECRSFIEMYLKGIEKSEMIIASGSLPLGIPDDFYKTLIEHGKNRGRKFILDTSGKYFMKAISAQPYMIKPNEEEIENVLGRRLKSLEDKVQTLYDFKNMGIELPCITMGKNGAVALLDDGVYHFYSPPIKTVNTVGSGDSFVAGCAVALSRHMSKFDATLMGMACGMANTQFFKTGMVSLELVEKYIKTIEVEKIQEA